MARECKQALGVHCGAAARAGRRSIPAPSGLGLALITLAWVLAVVGGCEVHPGGPGFGDRAGDTAWGTRGGSGGTSGSSGAQPTVRVRIGQSLRVVRLDASTALTIQPLPATPRSSPTLWRRTVPAPVTISRVNNDYIIRPHRGHPLHLPVAHLHVTAAGGSAIRYRSAAYPDTLVLHGVSRRTQAQPDRFDLVNHTPLERYLPGVLQRELYRHWHLAAFEAQAVAARSYALYQSTRHRSRHYDLDATTSDQVYHGLADDPQPSLAVQKTRGLALMFQGRVLPAFYSSCCGGRGQDASAISPRSSNLPPLLGREHDHWCAASPRFRWGPIHRNRRQLSRRIAAWGNARRHPVAQLGMLNDVVISTRNAAGRPIHLTLTDTQSRSFVIAAERFRAACNFSAPDLSPLITPLPTQDRLPSSDVAVRLEGPIFHITGRGFGHGVGLCQWGAQGLAEHGYRVHQILAFYYPDAELEHRY